MKKIKLLILLMAFFVSFATFAKNGKIAVVNMEAIFKGYYKTKINSAKFKRQADMFKKYADNLANSQLKLEEEFKVLRDNSQNIAFSDTVRESKRLAARDKYRQLQAKQMELQNYNRDKSEELKKQYEKMRKELLGEIKKTVEKYADKNGYVMVVDYSGKTMNEISFVVFYNKKIDITKIILKEINKGIIKNDK